MSSASVADEQCQAGIMAPPSYSPTMSDAPLDAHLNTGFPGGYFLVRSVATDKVLDVSRGESADGTEILLWRNKEKSLVEGMREPDSDNQVFFVDLEGNLCSKVAGLPIDVEGTRLVVRHHRPITVPFPNAFSHPLPRFSYDTRCGLIRVTHRCDPTHPAPSAYPSSLWKDRDHILTSVPLRRPQSVLQTTADFLSNAASLLSGTLGGASGSAAPAHAGAFDLRQDEVIEEERAPEDEDDDSPSHQREVRVLNLPTGWMEKERNLAARRRRQWEILPLLPSRMTTRPQPRDQALQTS